MVKAPGQHHQECLPTHFAPQQSRVLNLSWCGPRVPQAHRWQWGPAWSERTCRTCGWRRWPRWRRWRAWRRDWERPSRRCWRTRKWRWPREGKYKSPCKMRSAHFLSWNALTLADWHKVLSTLLSWNWDSSIPHNWIFRSRRRQQFVQDQSMCPNNKGIKYNWTKNVHQHLPPRDRQTWHDLGV